jgi:glucosamine 6-phosphate synthetase-like amidotransferase/phosphosugar isomerase protein
VNPEHFRADLAAKPDALARLAGSLRESDSWADTAIDPDTHLVMLGMGSSHYANTVAAARLRSRGIDAVAELASSDLLPQPRPGTVVVAVSAGGGSVETLDAVARYDGACPVVALTNTEGSAITSAASSVIPMLADVERSGVACRSFQHTLALWLALESRLLGGVDVPALLDASAIATGDLIAREGEWLPRLTECAIGPQGTHFVAPVRRLSSAQQGALMLRETPRLPAVGCETGDWSHVDVYLTKTTDYRLVLFAGSRWEPQLLAWVAERGSTLVSVGGEVPGAAHVIRFPGDDVDDVRLLTEVVVAELLAASLWAPRA